MEIVKKDFSSLVNLCNDVETILIIEDKLEYDLFHQINGNIENKDLISPKTLYFIILKAMKYIRQSKLTSKNIEENPISILVQYLKKINSMFGL